MMRGGLRGEEKAKGEGVSLKGNREGLNVARETPKVTERH